MSDTLALAEAFRKSIESGEPQWGTFLAELCAPGVPPTLRHAGLDFLIIDNEHSTFSQEQTRHLLDAGAACGMFDFVRTMVDDIGAVTRALDGGAHGILFPRIRTLDDVRRAVDCTKYPPRGHRGLHLLRPNTGFDVPEDMTAYAARANTALITAVQIETPEAMELIDPIAAIDGVDMLYIGPGDLGLALDVAGRDAVAEIRQVEEKVAAACAAHGKIAGIHFTPEHATRLRSLGFRVFGYSAAARLLGEGAEALMDRLR